MIDMISMQRIDKLHPILRPKAKSFLVNCSMKNIGVRITQGMRTYAEQDKLYAQGRSAPGKIVTNAKGGQSWHNVGLAFDFCLWHADKSVSWDMLEDENHDGISDWLQAVEVAKDLDLEWGGDWSSEFRDYPHFQLTCGLTLAEARKGQREGKCDKEGFILAKEEF